MGARAARRGFIADQKASSERLVRSHRVWGSDARSELSRRARVPSGSARRRALRRAVARRLPRLRRVFRIAVTMQRGMSGQYQQRHRAAAIIQVRRCALTLRGGKSLQETASPRLSAARLLPGGGHRCPPSQRRVAKALTRKQAVRVDCVARGFLADGDSSPAHRG